MAHSTDPKHFFQSEAYLTDADRKTKKSTNTLGNPIKLPAKILDLHRHPQKADHVFAACSDAVVRLVRVGRPGGGRDDGSKSIKATLRGPTAPVSALASTSDTLYAASWDMSIYAYSLSSLKLLRKFRDGHSDFVKCVAVGSVKDPSSTGSASAEDAATSANLLITGGADGYVVVWNAGTGDKMHVLRGHTRGVLDLAVQPQVDSAGRESKEELVVWSAGSERAVRQWVISATSARSLPFATASHADGEGQTKAEQKLEDELLAHETSVNRLRFSVNEDAMGDGHAVLDLLTASSDKTASLHTLTLKGKHPQPAQRASFTHPDFVRDALLLPTGQIATACRDEKVRYWDVEASGESDEVFDGHFEEVSAMALCTVGEGRGEDVLVSGSIDGTVRCWPVDATAVGRWKREIEEERRKIKEGDVDDEKDSKGKDASVQLTEDEERELAELMDDD